MKLFVRNYTSCVERVLESRYGQFTGALAAWLCDVTGDHSWLPSNAREERCESTCLAA